MSLPPLPPNVSICESCGSIFQSSHASQCIKCMLSNAQARLEKEAVERAQRKRGNSSKSSTNVPEASPAKKLGKRRPRTFTVNTPITYAPRGRRLITNRCALCGQSIPLGQMLKHKEDRHGEYPATPSAVKLRRQTTWVRVYQGGLPSLGKRSR